MPNYENTIIYKIVCRDTNIKNFYIGHTTNFTRRKCMHKKATTNQNRRDYNRILYETIRNNGGFENWQMVEIKKICCNDKREAEKHEREAIEELKPDLNITCPIRKSEGKINYILKHSKKYKECEAIRDEEEARQNEEKMKILKQFFREVLENATET